MGGIEVIERDIQTKRYIGWGIECKPITEKAKQEHERSIMSYPTLITIGNKLTTGDFFYTREALNNCIEEWRVANPEWEFTEYDAYFDIEKGLIEVRGY